MQADFSKEARRQIEICNACRYCEGYCDVFPALMRKRIFTDGDLTQLANLCHNCRGCYYACQYTAPHEFDLNLPKILSEVRASNCEEYAWPASFARIFQRSGVALVAGMVLGIAVMFWVISAFAASAGEGFYGVLAHASMVAIFTPAFFLPLASLAFGLHRYWRDVDGKMLRPRHFASAISRAASLRNLAGGHGEGCNFEDEDRFSNLRRWLHQATMWGFLMCFASTSAGTVLHYGFDLPAPYAFFSLPKLLGVPGGILLSVGALGLAWLKTKGDSKLASSNHYGGEMAFVLLLAFVSLSGLALYAATDTSAVRPLLAIHLGAVMAFFITLPFSKMSHAFFRFAALLREAQEQAPSKHISQAHKPSAQQTHKQ